MLYLGLFLAILFVIVIISWKIFKALLAVVLGFLVSIFIFLVVLFNFF
jgi:hypothetical protein